MKETFFKIFILLFAITSFCYSYNNQKYSGLNLNDTLKVIDKNKSYHTRLYFFTNLAACNICNVNINNLYEQYGRDTEFIVFVDGADNDDLSSLRKDIFTEEYVIIGDEFGIYKAYYKVKMQPLLVILDNNGIVRGWDKVTSLDINLDSIISESKSYFKPQNKSNFQSSLKEKMRIKVLKEGQSYQTSFFRECIFNKNNNNIILVNMRQPLLIYIDNNGNIIKEIELYLKVGNIIEQVQALSWAEQDSVVFIYGSNRDYLAFQLYDIINDKIIFSNNLRGFQSDNHYSESYNAEFLTGSQRFVNSIWFIGNTKNRVMEQSDTCAKLWSDRGKLLKSFDSPNSNFRKFKQSDSFNNIFGYSDSIIYSMQSYGNTLKKWNINGEPISTLILDLGKKYRKTENDIKDFDNDESVREYWNSISSIEKIVIDKSTNNFMIFFENAYYPEGIYDFMSDEVIYQPIFNIFDSKGNKLNKYEIIMPKGTEPFYFEDNKIYTTEMNGNKLEIAIYEFIED